ncbi:MAG: LysR substrate-binding domain-containing protein [Pseudomonadota bacterium]
MKDLTLRQLRYFEALAAHGHFGRAAEACAVSQPALSVQIKELEESVGARLFAREPREVRLTPLGEEFLARALGILRAVDELGDLAQAARAGLVGRLRLGVIPTIAPYVLPSIIGALKAAHPDVDLHVRETLTSGLLADLRDGKLDAAILALPVSEPSLAETPLFTEKFLLVRPESAAEAPAPTASALVGERLLLLEEGHCFRDQALAFCGMPAGRQRDGLDGSSLSTLVQMVASGIGVTLIPEMAEAVETRSAPVSVARFDGPAPSRTIGMVWRRSSPLASHLTDVAKIVGEAIGDV